MAGSRCSCAGSVKPSRTSRASEIPPAWWPSQNRPRDLRSHPTDEQGEPTVGRAADTRRTDDARHRRRPNNCGEVNDQASGSTFPGLEDIPGNHAEPHPRRALRLSTITCRRRTMVSASSLARDFRRDRATSGRLIRNSIIGRSSITVRLASHPGSGFRYRQGCAETASARRTAILSLYASGTRGSVQHLL